MLLLFWNYVYSLLRIIAQINKVLPHLILLLNAPLCFFHLFDNTLRGKIFSNYIVCFVHQYEFKHNPPKMFILPLTGVCGWLAPHQCVWLSACAVCLPADDLRGSVSYLSQRGGVRCRLLRSGEFCHPWGSHWLIVWLSVITSVCVAVGQGAALVVNSSPCSFRATLFHTSSIIWYY